MSIEGIITRIKQDAEASAEHIMKSYKDRAEKIRQDFKDFRKREMKKNSEAVKIERDKSEERTINHARSVANQRILKAKQEMLSQLYVKVHNYIENLSDDKYADLFANLLAEVPLESGNILLSLDSDVLEEKFLNKAEDLISKEKGEKPKYILKKVDGDFRGFYLGSGKVRYDLTLDSVLMDLRDKTEPIVIKMLF